MTHIRERWLTVEFFLRSLIHHLPSQTIDSYFSVSKCYIRKGKYFLQRQFVLHIERRPKEKQR